MIDLRKLFKKLAYDVPENKHARNYSYSEMLTFGQAIIEEQQQINNNECIAGVMPCFPSDDDIQKAAAEYEEKASLGNKLGDAYTNDDFVSGVEWLKSFFNKA